MAQPINPEALAAIRRYVYDVAPENGVEPNEKWLTLADARLLLEEISELYRVLIRLEEIERERMTAALVRDERAAVDALKQLQNMLCRLSRRARTALGLPSLREELRGDEQAQPGACRQA